MSIFHYHQTPVKKKKIRFMHLMLLSNLHITLSLFTYVQIVCWDQLEEKILSLLLIAIIIAFKCKRLHLIIVIIVLKCKILHLNGKHCIKSQCTLNFKAKDCIYNNFLCIIMQRLFELIARIIAFKCNCKNESNNDCV